MSSLNNIKLFMNDVNSHARKQDDNNANTLKKINMDETSKQSDTTRVGTAKTLKPMKK